MLLFLCLNNACSSDSDDEPTTPELILSAQEMTFAKSGGTQTLSIATNAKTLDVTSQQPSWCIVKEVASNSTKVHKFEVTAQPNSETSARETAIDVKAGTLGKSIRVTQGEADGLLLESTKIENVKATGETVSVKLKSNRSVSIKINDSWITKATTRAMQEYTYTFLIATNYGDARTGSISFTAGDLTESVTITQVKGEKNELSGGSPAEVATTLGMGWNLGNQLDAHINGIANETSWGNQPATQATFDRLRAAGFQSVRIPVTWMGHIGAAPDYQIEEAWMNRVAEVVGYAKQAGLKALINIHHDGADSNYWLDIKNAAKDATKNAAVKEQLSAVWRQIAERFKNEGSYLIFESMNEIHDGSWGWGENKTDGGKQYQTLNEWNQVFVDAVRATGGENSTRFLGIATYCTDPEIAVNGSFVLPNDAVTNRLLVSVHYYAPSEYSLECKYAEWGHTGAADKKPNWGDEAYVKSTFGKLKQTFIDAGIPVYIGEMGAAHRSNAREETFRKYYLEYVCKAAKEYGLTPFYWDNGSSGAGKECSGIINHATGAWQNNGEEVATLMVKAVTNTDASYTLESVYNNAPQ